MSNSATEWSKTAGKLLGQLSAIWFAVMMAALIFTFPTKLLFEAIKWVWCLF